MSSAIMNEEEIIISGQEVPFEIFNGSVAQYMIPKMKSQRGDLLMHVDADTGETVNRSDFLKLTIQIAEGMMKQGMQQQDVVVLLGKNSISLTAAALGVLWQGGVFAPLDPSLKTYELQHMFKSYKPRYVMCENTCVEEVKKSLAALNMDAKIIFLDHRNEDSLDSELYLEDILTEVDVENYDPLPVDDPVNQLAFIICSSGSTGLPKGVCITHRNIIFQISLIENGQNDLAFAPGLQTSHFFWISAMYSVFLCCLFETTRYFIATMNEVNIMSAIQNYKTVWSFLPPAEITGVLNHPDMKSYDLSSLKMVVTGGSPLQKSTVDLVKNRLGPEVIIFQGYGISEMTGNVTAPVLGGDIFCVGKPIFGTQMKIVDTATGKSLGPNERGEVLFKSKGMMKGYIGDEASTKAAIDEKGWLHTGDVGYYTEDGSLYVVDRIKELIKYRNQQISPAEIEGCIQSLPGVLDAGVIGIPHDQDQYHPMALVVKDPKSDITEEKIVDYVRENLSDFKQLRKGVCFVSAIPRTATKKIKRPLLKEMALTLCSGGE